MAIASLVIISAVGSGASGGQSERGVSVYDWGNDVRSWQSALAVHPTRTRMARLDASVAARDFPQPQGQPLAVGFRTPSADIFAGRDALTPPPLACPPNTKPVSGGCIPRGSVHVVYGERCKSARRAVVFFRVLTWERQRARQGELADRTPIVRGKTCRWARYAAGEWANRARSARKALTQWLAYHHDWRSWLPAKWQRVGACETGYGRIPGDWRWNSGAYQGAFGFAVSSWDGFVGSADPKAGPYPSEAYNATPRQQYEVALAIYRMYGLSGWGCRGA